MKYVPGLLLLLSLISATLKAASTQLYLRGTIHPSFQVEIFDGRPHLLSNVKSGDPRPEFKIERTGNSYKITVIHP